MRFFAPSTSRSAMPSSLTGWGVTTGGGGASTTAGRDGATRSTAVSGATRSGTDCGPPAVGFGARCRRSQSRRLRVDFLVERRAARRRGCARLRRRRLGLARDQSRRRCEPGAQQRDAADDGRRTSDLHEANEIVARLPAPTSQRGRGLPRGRGFSLVSRDESKSTTSPVVRLFVPPQRRGRHTS